MIEIGRPADRVQETQVGHGERLPWWRSARIWVDGCSDLPIRRKPRSQPSIAATNKSLARSNKFRQLTESCKLLRHRNAASDWEGELEGWLKPFLDRLGHKARRRMCPLYVAGLIGPGERKSIQPMAEQFAGGSQLHQWGRGRQPRGLKSTEPLKHGPGGNGPKGPSRHSREDRQGVAKGVQYRTREPNEISDKNRHIH